MSLNDGFLYAFDADAQVSWRFDYTHGHQVMYASEPVIADLNQDGSPEVLFTTYGAPDVTDSGHLVVLAADGAPLHDIALPNPDSNGNGNGAPAAPAVGDLDGDGDNEVLGVPNVEMHEPYETQAYAVMVLEGPYGNGSRSAMRLSGWEDLPRGERPILVDGWYPPLGVPAAATVNLQGDDRPEIVVSLKKVAPLLHNGMS